MKGQHQVSPPCASYSRWLTKLILDSPQASTQNRKSTVPTPKAYISRRQKKTKMFYPGWKEELLSGFLVQVPLLAAAFSWLLTEEPSQPPSLLPQCTAKPLNSSKLKCQERLGMVNSDHMCQKIYALILYFTLFYFYLCLPIPSHGWVLPLKTSPSP